MHKKYAIFFKDKSKMQSVILPIMQKSFLDKTDKFFKVKKFFIDFLSTETYEQFSQDITWRAKPPL